MLIHRKSDSLILQLKDPTRVTSVLPYSREVTYKGKVLTQVRFGLDEVRVLRNLGINAPSPIGTYYDWAGPFTPLDHQRKTSEFLTLNPKSICLSSMGTGKTLSVLWSADYLMEIGKVRKALIIGPLSTVGSVWHNEVMRHFLSKRRSVVLHGEKKRRLKLLNEDADFYIINHDGIKTIHEELMAQNFDMVVVDEASMFRNATSQRYKALYSLTEHSYWVWLLTGTPCSKDPTDAWALSKLIRNPDSPKYFTAFKHKVMEQVTTYKWVPKPDAYENAYKILQPGIRFTKDECMDLPPVTYVPYETPLTKEQQKAYKEMQKELVADVSGSEITAANAAVKLTKLLQIGCGEVYDSEGGAVTINAKDRLTTCAQIVEGAERKVLVFVPFTAALNQVTKYLQKEFGKRKVAQVDGSTSSTKRTQIFDEFQFSDHPTVLVAHPQVASHGLTLTAADTTVWYAPVFSLETYEQANNRMDRPGQNYHMTVAKIYSTEVERRVYEALDTKSAMQQCVLTLYKEQLGVD